MGNTLGFGGILKWRHSFQAGEIFCAIRKPMTLLTWSCDVERSIELTSALPFSTPSPPSRAFLLEWKRATMESDVDEMLSCSHGIFDERIPKIVGPFFLCVNLRHTKGKKILLMLLINVCTPT